jgi:hypothetical protein
MAKPKGTKNKPKEVVIDTSEKLDIDVIKNITTQADTQLEESNFSLELDSPEVSEEQIEKLKNGEFTIEPIVTEQPTPEQSIETSTELTETAVVELEDSIKSYEAKDVLVQIQTPAGELIDIVGFTEESKFSVDLPLEASGEAITELSEEINTDVPVIVQEAVNELTEPSEPIVQPIILKDIVISNVYAEIFLSEVIYAASLGAKLTPRHMPSVNMLPFTVKMQLAEDDFDEWKSKESVRSFQEEKQYNEVVVRSPDPITFFNTVIDLAEKGAIIKPKTVPQLRHPYSAKLLMREPINKSLNIHVKADKVVYTKEELKEFDIHQLKIIGSWWGLTGRGKNALIKDILDNQKG